MIRLVLALPFIGSCLPALALDCPPGNVGYMGRCVPLRTMEYGFTGQSHGAPGASFLGSPAPLPPAGGAGSGSRVGSSFFHAARLYPVRAYLGIGQIPPTGIGAYGIVVLRARPTAVDRSRLRMMCQAFVATLAKQSQLPATITAGEQMLTVWPLDEPQNPSALADDCDYVLDTYALSAGDQAVADATVQGYSFSGQGPYLVGWSPSDTRGVRDKLALVVDMSGFDSQDSFNNAFLFWKQKVVEDPALWKDGFSVERFRLSIHDFADHYGQAFLDAVKLVSAK